MISNLPLNSVLETADIHAKRLRYAMQKLNPIFPISAERFTNLTEEEISIFDQFSIRFTKLQDLMGTKLFGLILEYSKEPGEYVTFLDKLHALEKLNCIPDAEQWLQLRSIRNHLSHEYPHNPEINADYFNEAFKMASVLLNVLDQVKAFIRQIASKQI